MFRKFALVIMLLILTLPATAETVLKGVVSDITGKPIPGAQVIVLRGGQNEAGIQIAVGAAKAGGAFEIAINEDPLSVFPRSTYIVASAGNQLGLAKVQNLKATQRVICGTRGDITGTVQDSQGQPVQGAIVEPVMFIQDAFFGQQSIGFKKIDAAAGIKSTITDEQGKFKLAGLPPSWDVRIKASTAEGTGDTRQANAVERGISVGASNAVITLDANKTEPTAGRIVGKLVDGSTEKPMPDIKIIATDPSQADSDPFSSITKSDGGFELKNLPPGSYTIWAPEADKPVLPETDIEVKAKESTWVTLNSVDGTQVSGRVLSQINNAPLSGVTVFAPGSKPILTQKDGAFSIRMLPGPGILSVIGDVKGFDKATHELDVPETGKVSGLVIKLPLAARVYGKVLDSSGKPVDGALVRVLTENGPSDTLQADSMGNYDYILENPKPGQIRCDLIAFDPLTGEGAIRQFNPITGKANRSDVNLQAAAKIFGTVKDSDGKGIMGASIMPMLEIGRYRIFCFQNRTATDFSGKFTLTGLIPGGKYLIRIEAVGFKPLTLSQEQLPALKSGETAHADFTLSYQPNPAK